MSSAGGRRYSYQSPSDAKKLASSAGRRFSENDCGKSVSGFSVDCYSPVFEEDELPCSSKKLPQDKTRRSSRGVVKSILKKQNSVENINYNNVVPLILPEVSSDPEEGSAESTSGSRLRTGKMAKSSHSRRVRFSQVALCHDDFIGSYNDFVFDDFFEDNTTLDEAHSLHVPLYNENPHKLPKTASSSRSCEPNFDENSMISNQSKARKDLRFEPVTKRKKVTTPCMPTGITSRDAWTEGCSTRTKVRKPRPTVDLKVKPLERAKTDLIVPVISYKDVQSKLRRMGFFESRRATTVCKNNDVLKRDSETVELGDVKTAPPTESHHRHDRRYSTLREELYDIGEISVSANTPLSVKYVTDSCGDENLRSLGDQYARFLKGRYNLDDVTCT